MNPELAQLHPYPFEKLAALKSGVRVPVDKSHISLSIGEPRHSPPNFVIEELTRNLNSISNYPNTKGITELRETIKQWLIQRYALPAQCLDAERHVLPVNGTREALFSFAQAVIDRRNQPLVVLPNPFYQIYEGATLLAGAEPYYLNTSAESNFLPDFNAVSNEVWQRCQLLYICSPGNPTGAVISEESLQQLITLADQHDFVIASDECYSEIYFDEANPPPGLLQAAANMGRTDFHRCVVFHSLSKRSNVPGLRSGFVAGDAEVLSKYLKYRTYHGCAMPEFIQRTSIKLWQDESHVHQNRNLYRDKFDQVLTLLKPIMKIEKPEAGFYLWPKTPIDDEEFSKGLYAQQNITVLPGSYLSRESNGTNPGKNYVRIALVAEIQECLDAAKRIYDYIEFNKISNYSA